MTTVTLRPDSTIDTPGGGVTGAATAHQATNDNSDATYFTLNTHAELDACIVGLNTTSIPVGAIAKSIAVRARLAHVGSACDAIVRTAPTENVTLHQTTTGTITTHSSGAQTVDGVSQAELDAMYLEVFLNAPATTVRFYELYMDFVYVARPVTVVTAVTPDPYYASVTVPIAWSNTLDADGGAQYQYQVKVFDQATYSAGGFDPNTSTPAWNSGEVTSASTSTVTGTLARGPVYRAYVRVAQLVNGVTVHWSNWAFDQFWLYTAELTGTETDQPITIYTASLTDAQYVRYSPPYDLSQSSQSSKSKLVWSMTGTPANLRIQTSFDNINWVDAVNGEPVPGLAALAGTEDYPEFLYIRQVFMAAGTMLESLRIETGEDLLIDSCDVNWSYQPRDPFNPTIATSAVRRTGSLSVRGQLPDWFDVYNFYFVPFVDIAIAAPEMIFNTVVSYTTTGAKTIDITAADAVAGDMIAVHIMARVTGTSGHVTLLTPATFTQVGAAPVSGTISGTPSHRVLGAQFIKFLTTSDVTDTVGFTLAATVIQAHAHVSVWRNVDSGVVPTVFDEDVPSISNPLTYFNPLTPVPPSIVYGGIVSAKDTTPYGSGRTEYAYTKTSELKDTAPNVLQSFMGVIQQMPQPPYLVNKGFYNGGGSWPANTTNTIGEWWYASPTLAATTTPDATPWSGELRSRLYSLGAVGQYAVVNAPADYWDLFDISLQPHTLYPQLPGVKLHVDFPPFRNDLVWQSAHVKASMTLRARTDRPSFMRFNLGKLYNSLPVVNDDGMVVSTEFQLADLSHSFATREIFDPLSIAIGTNVGDYIESILSSVFGVTATLPSTPVTTQNFNFDNLNTSWQEVFNTLLSHVGYTELWVDIDGNPQIEPADTQDDQGEEWRYVPGSAMLAASHVENLLQETPNAIRFVATPGGPALPTEGNGYRTKTNVDVGPASTTARGETVAVSIPVVAQDQAALDAIATQEANRIFSGGGVQIDLSVALNPLHDDRDVVLIEKPRVGVDAGLFLVTRWSIRLRTVLDESSALMDVVGIQLYTDPASLWGDARWDEGVWS